MKKMQVRQDTFLEYLQDQNSSEIHELKLSAQKPKQKSTTLHLQTMIFPIFRSLQRSMAAGAAGVRVSSGFAFGCCVAVGGETELEEPQILTNQECGCRAS